MKVESRLEKLGYTLEIPPKPVAKYVPYVRTGNLIFTSGAICVRDGDLVYTGQVGKELSVTEGKEAAKLSVLNTLSVLKNAIGDLDRVERIVKVVGFVASAPDFHLQPKVIDGASGLLEKIFSEKGRHARSAVGVSNLPLNAPVEIEMVVEVFK